MAGRLGHFARFLAACDPAVASLAGLDRQRHIEPYLAAVAATRNPRTGTVLSASERRSRILTVGRMIDDIIEWGWAEAPPRRLVFTRDIPRLPRALSRYLPPDADRALAAALHASPHRLLAAALLLLRATGMRIGELLDLELDCVHEVPGAGAWLKVPLGKLDTERMVPIDEDALALLDEITGHRSPGRPLPHPRTGKLADFLLTHQGRRVSAHTLRGELHRAAAEAGITGRLVRRYPAQAAEERGPHRPRAHRARLPEQAASHPAAQGQMRDLRANGCHPGSPRPGACRPQPARPAAAPMGQVMATIGRKTLVICGDCHDLIHGHPAAPLTQ